MEINNMYKKYLCLVLGTAVFANGPFHEQYNALCAEAHKKTGGFCLSQADMAGLATGQNRDASMYLFVTALPTAHYAADKTEEDLRQSVIHAYEAGKDAMDRKVRAAQGDEKNLIVYDADGADEFKSTVLAELGKFTAAASQKGERFAYLCMLEYGFSRMIASAKKHPIGPDTQMWAKFIKAAKNDANLTVNDFEAFKAKNSGWFSCLSCALPSCSLPSCSMPECLKGPWTCFSHCVLCLPCCKNSTADCTLYSPHRPSANEPAETKSTTSASNTLPAETSTNSGFKWV